MKLFALSVVIAYQFFAFAVRATCQDNQGLPERLHLTISIPESHGGRVALTALSIQQDLSNKATESIVHSKGNVELRMTTCAPSGKDIFACEAAMVLRADEVDYNETTGEIDARGNVRIAPYHFVTKP
jgi:lipopolysaccharide assembly outer membrane protein LptD (OstA)